MFGIAQHELERMLAGWKLDPGFGLARAKMKVRFVLRNWLIGIERIVHVYQQMVMAAVRVIVAGVRYAHVAQSKAAPEATLDDGAVLWPHEIQMGILVRGLALSECGKWHADQGRSEDKPLHQFHGKLASTLLRGQCDAESVGGIPHVGIIAVAV